MSKLYLLGDSWSSNYFKNPEFFGSEFKNALKKHGKIPYHIEDYLNRHYDVINLGYGGVSNVDIIYQFSEIQPYQQGDKLVVIWTSPVRSTIKTREGKNFTFGEFNLNWFDHPESPHYIPKVLQDSIKGKYEVLLAGIESLQHPDEQKFYEREFKFIEYLKLLHSNFDPIFFTWERTTLKYCDMENLWYGGPILNNQKVMLSDEFDIADSHLNSLGNWLVYSHIFDKYKIQGEKSDIKFRPYED